VVNRRKMDETVDSPPHTYDTTSSDMLEKQLGRIACLSGLLGREMAALGAGGPVEAVPIRLARDRSHAQTVTIGLVLCNRIPGSQPPPRIHPCDFVGGSAGAAGRDCLSTPGGEGGDRCRGELTVECSAVPHARLTCPNRLITFARSTTLTSPAAPE
jgi:hypothetical protein